MAESVADMEHPAAGGATGHPLDIEGAPSQRVLAGEFTERRGYATLRERGRSDWLLIYTIAGSGFVDVGGDTVSTAAGDAVLFSPRTRQHYGTSGDSWSLAYAHFHPRAAWAPLLERPGAGSSAARISVGTAVRPRLLEALRACIRLSTAPLAHADMFAMNSLEAALLWLDTHRSAAPRLDERILHVAEHISGDLAGALDTESLARVAHLSASRLSHVFTRTFGLSPQQYVERERMTRADMFLRTTDRAIADIARDVGFDDPLYFSRRFRRWHGVSPSEFRARHG